MKQARARASRRVSVSAGGDKSLSSAAAQCVRPKAQYRFLIDTQDELEVSRHRYAELYDQAPVGFVTVSRSGVIFDINPAAARLLNQPREKLIGRPLVQFLAAKDQPNFARHLAQCRDRMTRVDTELQLDRPDCSQAVFVELVSAPGLPQGANGNSIISILVDISRRKRAELQVQENEERFRALSENVAEGIVLLTAKGRIFYQSDSVERLLGYTVPELSAQPPPENLIHQEDFLRAAATFQEIRKTENCQREIELRIRHKNGSWRWLHIVGKNLLNDRAVGGIVLNARDVTEQREIYQALRDSEEHLRLAQKSGGIGSFDWNVTAGRASLSETCAVLLGLNPRRKRIAQAEWELRIHKDDREQMRRHWRRVLSGEEQVTAEYRIVRARDREVRWVAITGTVYRDAKGAPQRVVGTLQDITERIAARLVLQRSKEELETLIARRTVELQRSQQEMVEFFEQSPVGMLWVDKSGMIIRVNRAELELLGRGSADVLGEKVSKFSVTGQISHLLRRLARGETVRNYRVSMLHKDGGTRHVLIDANGLWKKGKLAYSRWFFRDITVRAELEREILQIAERERQRIGRDLHDDLCQQLTGIEFLSQSLAGQLQKNSGKNMERAREIAQMVRDAITHTRELAHGLSPMRLGLQQTLHELAVRTKKMFRVDCRFHCKKAIISEDDAVNIHLYRIAQESVSNAIKHGKARRIDIELARSDRELKLMVRDYGIGMPDRPRKSGGMGLRVMQYRASVIGGTLTVEKNIKGGTTVICTLGDQVVNEDGKLR